MLAPKTYPLIPDEAFLLSPEPTDMVRSKQRLIFEGTVSYSEPENQKLKLFQAYLDKNKIVLDPYWNNSLRLRMLQSCEYSPERTVKDMTGYLDWIKNHHPLPLTPKIQSALNEGLLYFTGRDYKYRPIIVFDVKKTLDSKLPSEEIIDIYTYYLDFVVGNLLVGGHVENWILIVDLNGSGVFSTIGMLQKVLAAMSNRFRCRMHSCHLVRCPGAFTFLWALVKKFLDDVTIEKISFTSKSKPQNLLEKCNPSQIQNRYGGSANNFTQFWPVSIRSRVYDVENLSSVLISVDEYRKLFKNSVLLNQKINKNLVQISQGQPQKDKEREKDKEKQRQKERDEKQKEKQRERESYSSKYTTLEPLQPDPKSSKEKSRAIKNTIYQLHHQSSSFVTRQQISRISVQPPIQVPPPLGEDQIEEQDTINQIIHFTLNRNKPITFSSYEL